MTSNHSQKPGRKALKQQKKVYLSSLFCLFMITTTFLTLLPVERNGSFGPEKNKQGPLLSASALGQPYSNDPLFFCGTRLVCIPSLFCCEDSWPLAPHFIILVDVLRCNHERLNLPTHSIDCGTISFS
jgi:hypothetical protein